MNDNLHPLFKNILKGITSIPNKYDNLKDIDPSIQEFFDEMDLEE